jgi:drug/metabolite transporter (DMT)-like permease
MLSTANAGVVWSLAMWYAASIGLIMFNKWALSYLGFHFPVAMMLLQQCVCTLCSNVAIRVFRLADPPRLSFAQIRSNVLPLAAAFAASISLMNEGQLLLSVSFLQMLKASIPFWTVVISGALGSEKHTRRTFVVVTWIGAGVALSASGAVEFQWAGVLLTMGGIICECVRLVLSQKLLQGNDIKFTPLTGVHFVAPCAALCLLPPYLLVDHARLVEWSAEPHSSGGTQTRLAHALPYLLANGLLAYALNLVVYNVITKTSAVTTGVAGKAKDVINIVLSSAVFGTHISQVQLTGYAIAMSGVSVYTYDKMRKSAARAAERVASSTTEHVKHSLEMSNLLAESSDSEVDHDVIEAGTASKRQAHQFLDSPRR